MDTQDHHKKNGSSGHENHEVHLCHKCGWPFPNPHPSAKHRRAHKKVCGTIEGYKLIESDAKHPHLAVSDDEHSSDDDRHTPSPKIDKRSVMEVGSGGGVGQKSNRSEDEVLSDAVIEFSDSGVSPGMEEKIRELNKEVEKLVNTNLNGSQLLKVDATADTAGQPNDRTWSSQTCKSEVIESARDQSETAKSLNDTTFSVGSSGIIGLRFESSPVKFETLTDVLIDEINEDVNRGTQMEPDINGNEAVEIDKALTDFIDPHIKAVRELSKQESSLEEKGKELSYVLTQDSVIPEADRERESELEATKEKSLGFVAPENVVHEPVTKDYELQMGDGQTSDLLSMHRIIEQKKDENSELEVNVPKNDVSSLVKPLEHMEDSVAVLAHAVDGIGQVKMVGVYDLREEGMEDLQSSSLKKEQEETRFSDVKEGNLSEAQNENMHSLSVPESLHVMDNAVHMIEDFKDYNTLKSSLPLDLGSAEVIRLVQGDDKATIAEEVHSGSHSGAHLSGSIESSSADLNALKHDLNEKGVEKPIEGKAHISGLIEESGEDRRSCGLEAPSDSPITEAQNIHSYDLSEGLHLHSIGSEPLQKAHSENATMEQSDIKSAVFVEVMQKNNLIEGDNADNHEVNKSEKNVPAGKDSSKEFLEDELSANKKTNQEHADNIEMNKSEKSVTARKESSKELLEDELSANKKTNQEHADNIEMNKSEKSVTAGKESSKKLMEDELSANKKTNQEHADSSFISEDDQPFGSLKVDRNQHHERATVEVLDAARRESTEVGGGEILVTNTEAAHEPAGQTPKSTTLDMVPDRCGDESFQEASQGVGSGNITDVADSISSASKDIEINHDGSLLESDENPEDSISKEVVPPRVDHELLNKNSATVEVSPTREALKNSSDCGSEPSRDEVDDKLGNYHDGVSAVNISVGSSSRADSLEGNWGSVSVVSAQSDTTATADTGGLLFADSQPPEKSEAHMQMPKHATDESHPDKADVFEPPSFMTLVESGTGVSQKVAHSEIQTVHNNQQPKPEDLQAGWFPSLSNVVNESQGRKKNEEIIAKVSNWSTGKQHGPLKDLLGEAKSPNSKQVQTVSPSDETATKSNGGAVTTVNAILHSQAPNDQGINKEMEKEWNSPARYPSEIKKEKRKGKPYWVPFVCCSSVNRDL